MSERVGSWVAIPRASRSLLVGLAAVALLLSAVGVFGVLAYAVRTRKGELGLRLALGASPGRLGMDLALTLVPVAGLGIGAGFLASLVAARAARAVLHGVSPLDPASLAAALSAMTVAVLLAVYLPVRRVSRISPTEAIRPD